MREHTFALLNRGTHVLDSGRETGYQIEATYGVSEAATLTGNVSRGEGLGPNRYDEVYAELRLAPRQAGRWEASVFHATGRDLISFISGSRTFGGAATVRHARGFSSHFDVAMWSATSLPWMGARSSPQPA